LWMLALIVTGVLVLARLIQADSPARSNAYWAVLPISRSAMFASKVAGAVMFLLVIALLGQYAALAAHGVEAVAIPRLLGASALSYGVWLAVAAVLAALAPDLRTFFLAFLLTTLGWMVGSFALASMTGGIPGDGDPSARTRLSVAIVGAALLLLAHQYRTRDVRQGVRIAVVAGVALIALTAAGWRSAPRPGEALAMPEHLRPAVLQIDEVRIERGGRGNARFTLRMEGHSHTHLYQLLAPTVHLHMPDGSTADLAIDQDAIRLNDAVPGVGAGVRWRGAALPPEPLRIAMSVDLTSEQREALSRGEARLIVQGRLEVREARIEARLPLEPGATVAANGQRLRHLSMEGGADPTLRVRVSSVQTDRPSGSRWKDAEQWWGVRYALMNPIRGEALRLVERTSSGTDFALVLPGPRAGLRVVNLQQSPADPAVGVTPDWLAQAHLLLFDWVPLGSAAVMFETSGAPRREGDPAPG
jgi:hypothetical protein